MRTLDLRVVEADLDAAMEACETGPVTLTKDGVPAFVMLSVADHEALLRRSGQTTVPREPVVGPAISWEEVMDTLSKPPVLPAVPVTAEEFAERVERSRKRIHDSLSGLAGRIGLTLEG